MDRCVLVWKRLIEALRRALFPNVLALFLQRWAVPLLILALLFFYGVLVGHNSLSYEWMIHECPMHLNGVPDTASFGGWMRATFNPRGYECNGLVLYYLYDFLADVGMYNMYVLRLLATIGGLVTLGGLAYLFCLLDRKPAGRTALTMALYALMYLVFNVLFLGYTSFARFYACNSACCVLALLFLVVACRRDHLVLWLGYALALGLSVASMVMSVASVLVHFFIVRQLAGTRRVYRRFILVAGVGITLFFLLWIIDAEGNARLLRQHCDQVNLWHSLFLDGSCVDRFPIWYNTLAVYDPFSDSGHLEHFWFHHKVWMPLLWVSLAVWGSALLFGVKRLRSTCAIEHEYSELFGAGVCSGLLVLSILFVGYYFVTGVCFSPLDLVWLCPFFAVAWASVLVRNPLLRHLFLLSLLIMPGYFWMGTYAQRTPFVRVLNQFSNRRWPTYCISSAPWYVPLDQGRSLREVGRDTNRSAALPQAWALSRIVSRANTVVVSNGEQDLSLLASELRSLPYCYHSDDIRGIWILLDDGAVSQQDGFAYFEMVINHLQRSEQAEVLVDPKTNFYWINPRGKAATEPDNLVSRQPVPSAVYHIPATLLAPRWQKKTPVTP